MAHNEQQRPTVVANGPRDVFICVYKRTVLQDPGDATSRYADDKIMNSCITWRGRCTLPSLPVGRTPALGRHPALILFQFFCFLWFRHHIFSPTDFWQLTFQCSPAFAFSVFVFFVMTFLERTNYTNKFIHLFISRKTPLDNI